MDSDMSQPSSKYQAVLTMDPPPWAQTLISTVADLQKELSQLKINCSSSSSADEPAKLPVYGPNITPQTISTLLSDPRVPDFVKPFLSLTAHVLSLTHDDPTRQLAQDAYANLTSWIDSQTPQEPSLESPEAQTPQRRPATPTTPTERFVIRQGRTYYRSKQGKLWDITQPPPYNCRRCHCLHWSWQQCYPALHITECKLFFDFFLF
jgi:hypothetical protein